LLKKVLLSARCAALRSDLAIEVVSEYDTDHSLKRKKERYLRCGIQEVWIVSTEDRQVEVQHARLRPRLPGDDELNISLIPGFRISVQRLFELTWE